MKKILVFAVALATLAAGAADKAKISLADATGKIGQAIENPAVMEELVSQLSAEDQVAFLARVNAAIESMPVSPAEKTAKYVDINSAAMKSAAKGNLASMLAETFATVPPASLVAINEVFANKLFNRAADPETVFTDEAYTKLAKDTMATIQKRNETADDSGVQSARCGDTRTCQKRMDRACFEGEQLRAHARRSRCRCPARCQSCLVVCTASCDGCHAFRPLELRFCRFIDGGNDLQKRRHHGPRLGSRRCLRS